MEKGKKETHGGWTQGEDTNVQAHQEAAEIERLAETIRARDKRKERLALLVSDLRGGHTVTDFRFDQVFPRSMRELSDTHWTPVEVALRAASLLDAGPGTRILDVGSGCGKFCLIGSLTTNSIYVGVEQRKSLVEIARDACEALNGQRLIFVHRNMTDIDWDWFDAFYLFNPFYEHCNGNIRIDQELSYNEETFERYVRFVEDMLAGLKVGTRVVTYHGFGGSFPPDFRRLICERAATGILELWEKTAKLGYSVPAL